MLDAGFGGDAVRAAYEALASAIGGLLDTTPESHAALVAAIFRELLPSGRIPAAAHGALARLHDLTSLEAHGVDVDVAIANDAVREAEVWVDRLAPREEPTQAHPTAEAPKGNGHEPTTVQEATALSERAATSWFRLRTCQAFRLFFFVRAAALSTGSGRRARSIDAGSGCDYMTRIHALCPLRVHVETSLLGSHEERLGHAEPALVGERSLELLHGVATEHAKAGVGLLEPNAREECVEGSVLR